MGLNEFSFYFFGFCLGYAIGKSQGINQNILELHKYKINLEDKNVK